MTVEKTIQKRPVQRPAKAYPEFIALLAQLIVINRLTSEILTSENIASKLGIKKQSIENQVKKQKKALGLI